MPRDIRKVIPTDAAGAILDVAMGGGKTLQDVWDKLDAIRLDADTVNLNTDEIEDKLDAIDDTLGSPAQAGEAASAASALSTILGSPAQSGEAGSAASSLASALSGILGSPAQAGEAAAAAVGLSTAAKQDTQTTALGTINTTLGSPAQAGEAASAASSLGSILGSPAQSGEAAAATVGLATSAKQDTGNSSLTSIDGKLPALVGGKVPVTDPTALPLPTGAATSADQKGLLFTGTLTGNGDTDFDLGGRRHVIVEFHNTGSAGGTVQFFMTNDGTSTVAAVHRSATSTSGALGASAVTMTASAQFRTVWAETKFLRLTVASFVSNIAYSIFAVHDAPTSVGVTTVVPGVGSGNLGKAEDAAHTSGDTGVAVLGVRNDAAATRTDADGDYSPISVDSAGRPKVVVDTDTDMQGLLFTGTLTGNGDTDFDLKGRRTVLLEYHNTGSAGGTIAFNQTNDQTNVTSALVRTTNSSTSGYSTGTGGAGTSSQYRTILVNAKFLRLTVTGFVSNIAYSVFAAHDATGEVFIGGINPGVAAGNLGKAEDAAHTSGDNGVFMLAVRNNNAGTSFSDTNGDYTPIAVNDRGQVFNAVGTQGATTTVTVSSSAIDLLAASNTRTSAMITNDGSGTVRITWGSTTPTTTLGHQLAPGAPPLIVPGGCRIQAIRTGVTDATVQVTELTY